ncbi:MAG: carboxypeptidase-like regulatory domain-containing protein, partial [Eudoraea sp.]
MVFKEIFLEYFNELIFYRRIVISCFLVLGLVNILSSQKLEIIGTIKANTVNKVIADAVILLEGTKLKSDSNQEGTFKLTTNLKGNFILNISAEGYLTKRMPIILEEKFLMLGEIWLTKNISIDLEQNKILLT